MGKENFSLVFFLCSFMYVTRSVFPGRWVGQQYRRDKSQNEMTSRITSFTQKCTENELPLKSRAAVANAYITSVIYYRHFDSAAILD